MIVYCFTCQAETEHAHLHDTAHGIHGTHMAGSERLMCAGCGSVIKPEDRHPFLPQSAWILDPPP